MLITRKQDLRSQYRPPEHGAHGSASHNRLCIASLRYYKRMLFGAGDMMIQAVRGSDEEGTITMCVDI